LTRFPSGREVAVSMVTVAELEMGVLAAKDPDVRARRLRTLRAAEGSESLPITRGIAACFAELVTTMRDRGLTRLGVQDAWIAATALAWEAELWTQDGDFEAVPGLNVVRL
jgi:predicted nucleic acid-binding protein